MIPTGSIIEFSGYNYTLGGEGPCDFCSVGLGITEGASKFTCSGNVGKYMSYKGNDCDGTPEIYNVILNGTCFYDICIGYNDVMYKYTGTSCQGEILSNTTVYGQWAPLNQCYQANSVDIINQTCQNGYPVSYVWHPPNLNCSGPPEAVVGYYHNCTPPYDGHTEMLTLTANPCAP